MTYEVYDEKEIKVYTTSNERDADLMAALYNGYYIEREEEENV